MNQEHPLNNPSSGLSAKGSARRKLVRGTFAVPAVLAVHSGSALATTSLGTCLRKANLSPRTEPVTTTAGADNIFRYQLWAYVRVAGATSTSPLGSVREADGYWIKGADLTPFVRNSQTPFVTNGAWQKFSPTTNALVGSSQLTTPTCGSSVPSNWNLQRVAQFVSLRVSSTGQIVGAGSTGGGGSAVGNSCWNSFAGGSGA